MRIRVLLMGLTLFCRITFGADLTEGIQAYENGRYDEAYAAFLPAAQANDVQAQYYIGRMYERKESVSRDYEEAARWYRKAAERGHMAAQCALGGLYEFGMGVVRNGATAAEWYRRAAAQGSKEAESNLAELVKKGIVAETTTVKAKTLPPAEPTRTQMPVAGRGTPADTRTETPPETPRPAEPRETGPVAGGEKPANPPKASPEWQAEIYFVLDTDTFKTDHEYAYEMIRDISRYTCAPGRVFNPLTGIIQDEENLIVVSLNGDLSGQYKFANDQRDQKSTMNGSISGGQVNFNSGEVTFSGSSEFVWDIDRSNPAYGHYTKSMTYTAKGSYTPDTANPMRPQHVKGVITFKYRHTGGPQIVYDKSFTGSFPFEMDFYGETHSQAPDIEVLDANPQYCELFDFTDVAGNAKSAGHAARAAQLASANTQKRLGAAADGVSLLLLRRELPGPGKIEFLLADDQTGALFPLEANVFIGGIRPSVSVDAVSTEERGKLRWWAFALYVPPVSFGDGKETRMVKVSLRFTPAPEGDEIKAEQQFKLIRPPVVLAHGTFDEPISCWATRDSHSTETMQWALFSKSFDVFLLDWEETNGHKDPSSFKSNAQALWINRGGIKEALETMRKKQYAVTQVDVVAHSQGGVITRVYANGVWTGFPRPEGDPHYSLPRQCAKSGCWYHRIDNWACGDIHRFITISATHMGSDACRVLEGFIAVGQRDDSTEVWESLRANLLLVGGGLQGNEGLAKAKEYFTRLGIGPLTEGYRDQTPGSLAYQAIGRTIIPSHAIACTCTDEDMMMDDALYQKRWGMIWNLASPDLLAAVFKKIGQAEDGEDLWQLKENQTGDEKELIANARRLRAAAFGNCPNDSTVREESSFGGLPASFRTVLPNVIHGSAPRFESVQKCVLDLLMDSGKKFCDEGFPAGGGVPINVKYVTPSPNSPVR